MEKASPLQPYSLDEFMHPEIEKIFWINRTKKKVGSEKVIATKRFDGKLQMTYLMTKHAKKDKVDIYFDEQEWINDIKKL